MGYAPPVLEMSRLVQTVMPESIEPSAVVRNI